MRASLFGPLVAALLLGASPLWAAPKVPKPEVKPKVGVRAKPKIAPVQTPLELLERASDPLKRETAALVLGRARATHALPRLLVKLRRDKNRWVRAACAEALGQIGSLRAVEGLRLALGREKNQRVRRHLGEALMRLGHKAGVLELMWQLRAGTRHDRAEAMRALVHATGQPLGQDLSAWWTYLARRGYRRVATRPRGASSLLKISDQTTMFSFSPLPQRLCATTLHIEGGPFGPKKLQEAIYQQGPGAEGCLLLLATRGVRGANKVVFAGITHEGVAYLLERFPTLTGLGIDRPRIAVTGQKDIIRGILATRKLGILLGLKDLHRLMGRTIPLIAIPQSSRQTQLLALLP
ncbi:MAG: HEAT repeat domain-containing protein [Deltaproteobacteria bacterium]|nr:HEAT repeat domain-containing protein [Deltaproteobacteria bacterium]